MANRRDFLKHSGNVALASFFTSQIMAQALAKQQHAIGLQLFTLFKTFDADVEGSLKKVSEIGIKEIESAFSMKGGFYGKTGPEFSKLVSDLGMKWVSHHVLGAPFKPRPGMDTSKMPKMLNLRDNLDEIIENMKGTGVKYMVCANIPIDNGQEIEEAVGILTKAGEKVKKAGMTFCYHNHDAEFKLVDGKKAFEVFAENVPADLLKFEIDLGWACKAGIDPVELFKKYPHRFPLCHIKDFDKDFKDILPVGEGTINYKRIFENDKLAGFMHFFVEHDFPEKPYESLATSFKNIRKFGLL